MSKGMVIYRSTYHTLEIPKNPHVDRHDGGHLIVRPKRKVRDRFQQTVEELRDLFTLTTAAGEAMMHVLPGRGIKLVRINFQDNDNWAFLDKKPKPHLHMHLYGRAKDSKYQIHGQALYFPPKGDGYYSRTNPLRKDDGKAIVKELKRLLSSKKYIALKTKSKI